MKKSGGYWVDSNNNKWSRDMYSKEQAEMYSATLIKCRNCKDCKDCIRCDNCTECKGCVRCKDCRFCVDTVGYQGCMITLGGMVCGG